MRLTDEGAPEAIAGLLGAEVHRAAFEMPEADGERGTPVYELWLRSAEHDADLKMLVWPSLSRVDVRLGKSTWTLKDVSEVLLYPGVEVLFRRDEPRAMLFVSVQGRVAMVS